LHRFQERRDAQGGLTQHDNIIASVRARVTVRGSIVGRATLAHASRPDLVGDSVPQAKGLSIYGSFFAGGIEGRVIGMKTFGASAPPEEPPRKFGFENRSASSRR
jgi:hypothetical protein